MEAISDPLTGAYSRALLGPRLDEELSRASRSETGCALFLFDVDYFKSINDAYGHPRGDEILCQLTERIHGLVRGYDVLFRYGGDEFVLLLPDTLKADAVRVALRLTQGIKSEQFPGDPPLSVSVSLGVATFPDDATDAEGLLAAADRRNYLAKHRGRACAVADDVETEARPASSRLLERDIPLSAAREFLTRVIIGESGALTITGERGAGFSRFLEEVARAGRLRGFEVLTTADPSTVDAAQEGGRPLLVVLDAALDERVAALADRLSSGGPFGLVFRTPESRTPEERATPIDLGVPVHDTAELHAWSSSAVRIWLRTALTGEADPVLVDWLVGRTGGLPARVERELNRLAERDALVRDERGTWSLSPALLTRAAPKRPLPQPLTELIGRHQEIAQVAQLLAERRLVTLLGPGGIGKTRLSLAVANAVAETFDDGVLFVPLADARAEASVVAATAQALDLAEVPGQALADTLAEYLADHSVLLVFDNFEQALDGADAVGDLLAAAPGVKALCSSREKLGLYGEQVYRVPALALPDLSNLPGVAQALASSPAIALYHARARAAAYDFVLTADNLPTVAALCHRLDGLPLAIELAAAHSDVLSPAEIYAQLSDRLELPGPGPRGVPARQQTLRGAIDWSYTLLDPRDQDLFVRLGVFAGGCALDAVAAVSGSAEGPFELRKRLTGLAEKSLIRAEPDGDEDRYGLLETVRAYARERLDERQDAHLVREAHAVCFSALAERAGTALTGPDQARWIGRVRLEYLNLRTAFEWGLTEAPPVAVEVAVGLWRYWRNRGQFREGRECLDRVLAVPLTDAHRARVLHAAAVLAAAHDDHGGASVLARESRERALAAGDARTAAQAGNALGIAMMAGGRHAEARAVFADCLSTWQRLGDPHGTAMAHGNLTMVALRLGEVDTASRHATECLELERAAGNTRGIMLALLCLGEIAIIRSAADDASTHLDEALALSRQIGDVPGEAMALHQLGLAALLAGDRPRATLQVAAALGLRRDLGDRDDLAVSLDTLAGLLAAATPAVAARLLGAADALRTRHHLPKPSADRAATTAALEAALGESFAAAHTTGAHASLDTVVDEALDAAAQAT